MENKANREIFLEKMFKIRYFLSTLQGMCSKSVLILMLICYNFYSNPTAIIEKSIESKDELAPVVASFSSRGPNPITADILKVTN